MSELKYVYQHLDRNGVVFYIGCGSKQRPWIYGGRSEAWTEIASLGYTVEVLAIELTDKALELEREYISDYGLDTLTNGNKGVRSLEERTKKNGTIKKVIDFKKDTAINIQALATLEDRSFGGQVRQLIKEALTNREVKK